MASAHTSPSWADEQLASNRPNGTVLASSSRSSSKQARVWGVVTICLLLSLVPFFLPSIFSPFHNARERLVLFLGFAVWLAVVAIATIRIIKWLQPGGVPTAAVAPSFQERALNWTGVLLSLLALYAIVVSRHPIPLWLWGSCVTLVAVAIVVTLRSLPPQQRGRIAPTVYAEVIGLCVLFPITTMPRASWSVAFALVTVVMIAMIVLMLVTAARLRAATSAAKPQVND
jgi:hypothetical protein